MSIRVYQGPHADGRRTPITWAWLPWLFAGITIGGQIIWLLAPAARDALTIITVVSFFLASASHAWLTRGFVWALGYVAIAAGIGWAMEAIGVRTGIPFGPYSYADSLGPLLLGVPVLVMMAWAMMAYPCLLAGRRLSSTRAGVVVFGAWLLAAWDLFLDPQMVSEGHWTWSSPDPGLPGIPGIPLSNYLGWVITALLIMALLARLPAGRPSLDGVPTLMLAWVYCSNVLANAVFFGRPWVALWGGIIMGIVVVPWAWVSWTRRP
ncbi:MAG: carotenoid biosynthesis protein [Candidatus Nanopelagicales bacterium]